MEMKKTYWAFLLSMVVVTNASSGEWDYVPNVQLEYIANYTEAEYNQRVYSLHPPPSYMRHISKLPKEVNQAMWQALGSYDLDVGDVFIFSCGYEWTSPKIIAVTLRITKINRDGTYTYDFYAVQRN
jgi:hypothetical protein